MVDDRLIFYLIASIILLIIGIRTGIIYFRWRTKHNLATLIIVIILFVGGALSYFYPGKLIPGAGTAIQILLGAIFVILLSAFLFYPEIKGFLSRRKMKNPDKMEEEFRDRLKQSPQNPELLYKYANFLWYVREDYDKADKCFQKAIELDPRDATILCNCARFLMDIREDYDRSESYYQKAIELDSQNVLCLGDYAWFLWWIRKDYDKANGYFLRAIDVESNNADILHVYANFLFDARQDYDSAETFYKQTIEINPKSSRFFGAYAYFLMEIRKDYDHAEDLFKKAVKLDPKDTRNLGAYALLLMDVRRNYHKAEDFYKRAIELGTKSAEDFGNYAKTLIVRGNLDKAKTMIERAFEYNKEDKNLELELELWFYCYSMFYEEFPESEKAVEALLAQGVRSHEQYLQDVLEIAQKRGHPDSQRLSQYESKITSTAS